ncbi:MAG: ATPase [Candidatus Hydrogenedentes bacterium]|nr:ATPase [Candidatus Hydrogenedentota bacterium]
MRTAGLAIAAALAIGLTGLATARVQAAVGAGGTGAMAEKPELFTNILVLFAIPETIVVLGFVVAYLLLSSI